MKKLVILSGAGLSAESGLPTFRDANGLWENHRVEDICNIQTWKQNYDLVHQFYNERRVKLGTVQPNAAPFQIAKWEAEYPTTILTQNVDDLLEQAGCKNVVHLHGFLTEMRCTACGNEWDIGYTAWGEADRCPRQKRRSRKGVQPHGPQCGSRRGVKPNVVFFGESAPMYAELYEALASLQPGDVFLVVGTMGIVLPVDMMARRAPCTTILNNLAPSEAINAGNFNHVFYEPATEAVGKIDGFLRDL